MEAYDTNPVPMIAHDTNPVPILMHTYTSQYKLKRGQRLPNRLKILNKTISYKNIQIQKMLCEPVQVWPGAPLFLNKNKCLLKTTTFRGQKAGPISSGEFTSSLKKLQTSV